MKTLIHYAIAFLVLLSLPAFSNDFNDAPRPRHRQARKYVKKHTKKRARQSLTARQRRARRARLAMRARVAAQRTRTATASRTTTPRRTAPTTAPTVAATPKTTPSRRTSPHRPLPAASRIDPRTVGVWRGGAKLTVAHTPDGREAPMEIFGSLATLLETLPADAEYGARNGTFAGSRAYDPNTRFRGEWRNVRVPCWVHAIRFDSTSDPGERDIQIVIGTSPDISRSKLMLVEIPRARPDNGPDDPRFAQARQEALRLLPPSVMEPGFHRTGARPVVVEGSLFFDGFHTAGTATAPGPDWAKPTTVWEIHPVTSFLIEEQRLGDAGRE